MAKYIEADKLAEHKFSYVTFDRYVSDGKPKSEKEIYAYKVGYNDAIDRIVRFAPPADVRENVHAHWIHERLVSTGGGSYPVVRCSACQRQYPMSETRFCPNCGVQMDEEEPTMEEYMYGQEGSEEDGSL